MALTGAGLVFLYAINICNACYIRNSVRNPEATKRDKLDHKKVKWLNEQYQKKRKRQQQYEK